MFIVFEGIDGAGKSTQARLLEKALAERGYKVVATHEPYKLDVCIDCYRNPMAQYLLYTADRVEHLTQVILPALERNNIVICDRFLGSSLAYQGVERGMDIELMLHIARDVGVRYPKGITFLFNIEPALAMQRAGIEHSNHAYEYYKAVSEAYHALVDRGVWRWVVVDAEQPEDVVHNSIVLWVLSELKSVADVIG